jgi:hypothetical protein
MKTDPAESHAQLPCSMGGAMSGFSCVQGWEQIWVGRGHPAGYEQNLGW